MEKSEQLKPDPFNFIRIPVQASVSYLLSNIATTETHIATVRSCDPAKIFIFELLNKLTKGNEYAIQQEQDAIITYFTYIQLKDQWKLVVCLRDCVKIYSENGQTLYFHHLLAIPAGKKKELDKNGVFHYFCAATKLVFNGIELICVCNSLGDLIFLEENSKKPNNFSANTVFRGNLCAIPTQMVHCGPEYKLFVANVEGKFSVFHVKDLKKPDFFKEIDTQSHKTPLTGINLLKKERFFVVTADFIGKIKVFDSKSLEILLEISSHARIITSLDTKSEVFMEILSSSEDSFLNFWRLELDEDNCLKISLKVSFRVADQIIIGAKYLKNSSESAISIYDSNEITVLKYEKN